MSGLAVSLPRIVVLTLVTGTGPPAVVAVKTSSADRNSAKANVGLCAGDAKVDANLQDGFSGNAFEHSRSGCAYFAVDDCEDIKAWAFGDIAVGVEQYGGVIAGIERIKQGGGHVAPVIVFNGRINADEAGMRRQVLFNGNMDAPSRHLLRDHPDEGNGPGVKMVGAGSGITRARNLRRAAGGHHGNIG